MKFRTSPSKQPPKASTRSGSGIPPHPATGAEFICRALIVRAFRRVGLQRILKGGAGVATLAIDDPSDAKFVDWAACTLLGDGARNERSGWHVVDLVSHKSQTPASLGIDLLQQEGREDITTVFIVGSRTSLSSDSAAMIDGCAKLDRPDWIIVKAAFRAVMGQIPATPLPKEMLAVIPLSAYGSAIRPGAGCSRAIERLRRLAENRMAWQPGVVRRSKAGPAITDLHGLGEAAEWGKTLARDLQDYRAGRIRWRDVDRGALLSGPFGCGKTTFAQALGRTCGVPVHVHSLAEWQTRGHLNDVLKAMREAFALAKATAPSVLFIDEIDSFGDRAKLSGHNATYNREVINALLECLDGVDDREGVVVVGATNYPEVVDAGLRRPGRLDRHIVIPLPDLEARIGILQYHLAGDLAGHDLVPIAKRLEGASGAALEQVVRSGRRLARVADRFLAVTDLEASLPATVHLSGAAFKRSCIHEAAHLITALLLEPETGSTPVEAVVNREVVGVEAGHTLFKRDPGFDRTRSSSLAEAVILLAGVAGERVALGDVGLGAGGRSDSDLALATRLLAEMELSHGLGNGLVFAAPAGWLDLFSWLQQEPGLRRRVDALLRTCLDRAVGLLSADRPALDAVADVLARYGRISAADAREKISTLRPSSDRVRPIFG
ncbi:ATP-binding protein [Methylobacterium sp. Leaf361]|uniref:ATP-binding protein n=1 Tax=Methylobacterium sp. Leaf361 TaxID=1736352 RepID=UPI0009EB4B32|nr:ATP-binding protein [Methylobacterium sp. Leaf361]